MLIIDFNQIVISSLHGHLSKNPKDLNEDLIRHIALNSIRYYVKEYRRKYGEVVIAHDSKNYWRKDAFVYYKASRKKLRETSDLDWNFIFECINKIKSEIKEFFPYKSLEQDGAEADDIIGTLVPLKAAHEKVMIVSADGDFLQLQKYPGVEQYSPKLRKKIVSINPALELKEKIIRGDSGDGIPNILSEDECFVSGGRQKSITAGRLETLLESKSEEYDEIAKYGWSRNETLIDLSFIPTDLKVEIIKTYDEFKVPSKGKILNYFVKHKLKNLMDVIEDF